MFTVIKPGTNFDFVGKYPLTTIISVLLTIVCLIAIVTKTNYGVDFKGGAEIQLKFKNTIGLDELRTLLDEKGFKGVNIQTIGDISENEILVKVQGEEKGLGAISEKISLALSEHYKDHGVEIRKVDIVGPKAGSQLRTSAFLAMLWALIAIMVYLGLRFDMKYAPGAVIATMHDVILIMGIYALTGKEFSLQTVGAVLAIIGYSVNDTVIVYDRVREHEQRYPGIPLSTHINRATNETLSRTILTSSFTMLVTTTLWLFGGTAIKDFFFMVTIGIIVGTYSSVFVASASTLGIEKYILKKI